MKKIGLALWVMALSVLLSGVAFADCESDCDGPFQTCLNICRQTTKVDSAEAAKCVDHCLHGVSGCIKKCREKEKKSENYGDSMIANAPVTGELVAFNTVVANSCIEKGLICILNGTPCCSPYKCKGKFPNTYCK